MIGAEFQCNICGNPSVFNPQGDWRETPSCTSCGSSVRMRSLIHVLTTGLFGESRVLTQIERTGLTGIGMSDWEGYADRLGQIFDYTNTFFHQEPLLDVVAPDPRWIGSSDFMISSDVFEHVLAPVSRAFQGAFDILKPGGLLVLTVPYGRNADTIEHYGEVADFKVVEIGGQFVVLTVTPDGKVRMDPKPVFHGGPGTTVEMRMFSLPAIRQHLEDAGFHDIEVHDGKEPRYGVLPSHAFGLPISARRPL